jgi:hypothetical protein
MSFSKLIITNQNIFRGVKPHESPRKNKKSGESERRNTYDE